MKSGQWYAAPGLVTNADSTAVFRLFLDGTLLISIYPNHLPSAGATWYLLATVGHGQFQEKHYTTLNVHTS